VFAVMRALQLVSEDEAELIELQRQPRFSPRELDCVRLLVRGFTDEEIASDLAISHATVRFHLDGARRKATARSRTHLAALAVARGVAQP
jgi:DNA-binding CsgD family transcriptional regulator